MHSMEPFVYQTISTEHFSNLEKLAQKNGLSIVSTSGQTKKDGVEVEWDYDFEAETLTIKVKQSPFWMPEQVLAEHFAAWMKDTQPGTTTVIKEKETPTE